MIPLSMPRLDRYIIKQFLGTYVFSIILIISVAVIFDINEKIDDFLKPEVSVREIIFDYYVNFIPFYANLFSPLFTFIAVIFFTSKLAEHSEVIAMLSTGVSFRRLMRPYMLSAAIIALSSFVLSSYVIPPANRVRIDFQNKYIKNKKNLYAESIQMEVDKGVFAYFGSYSDDTRQGYQFSMERFDSTKLRSRLTAERISYRGEDKWRIHNYVDRRFVGLREEVTSGRELDTTINVLPSDLLVSENDVETMTTPDLNRYIARQKSRGVGNALFFAIELHKRYASIMAAFILTIIGASLSARKLKGGMGFNIAIGLTLSFGYILFTTITTTFAVSGAMSPWLAAWLPNFTYIFIAIFLYSRAPQ